ncbi:IclR family transcriptional regulator [Halobacterium sp. KA-6]|uniref:IclR family transcriptional regulator n=1 Tax=Halobacterium sp. KA-6 TaxID=2896368 RepID=UPI001E4D9E91|nr:IclR family transcriptional regulator [Halobacterium sp. KA-6]MCD2204578.1 IclR family transcriptional regulator [Halobacterium sp. KA-6]
MLPNSKGRLIKSLESCFDIIEFLMQEDGGTLDDIADNLEVSRSTAHNHLSTLAKRGYVERYGQEYRVGLGFLQLGEYAKNSNPQFTSMEPIVCDLAERTGEEADFTVPENGRLVSLYHEVGQQKEPGSQVGSTFYMHNTAAGKSILAELSTDQINDILDCWGMPSVTEQTITDRDELFSELEEIRSQGYAVNNQEYMDGYRSVGAVVTNSAGTILGSLCVGGPKYRMSREK